MPNIPVECTVCGADYRGFPSSPPTRHCSHPADICHTCLQEIIRTAVEDGSAGKCIVCPNESCDKKLEFADVETWVTNDVFQLYDILLLKLQLGQDEEFIRCLNVSCSAGQFHSGADNAPLIRCYSCGSKQCHQHRSPWHEGFTCEQWDEESKAKIMRANDKLSQDLILVITKPCPGPGCGRRIQKADGCEHMTCRPPGGCGFEFCWICLAPYTPIRQYGNSRHYDNCDHYAGSLGGHPAPQNTDPPIRPDSSIENGGLIMDENAQARHHQIELLMEQMAIDSVKGEDMKVLDEEDKATEYPQEHGHEVGGDVGRDDQSEDFHLETGVNAPSHQEGFDAETVSNMLDERETSDVFDEEGVDEPSWDSAIMHGLLDYEESDEGSEEEAASDGMDQPEHGFEEVGITVEDEQEGEYDYDVEETVFDVARDQKVGQEVGIYIEETYRHVANEIVASNA